MNLCLERAINTTQKKRKNSTQLYINLFISQLRLLIRYLRGSVSISLHFPPPHSASVDFTDRMIIDTRDYNLVRTRLSNREVSKLADLCERTPPQ